MPLKLGVIGMSPGNGHPYSWSAIFNGYAPSVMESCGFPVIPRYLERQSWPADRIVEGNVTHVWTQDEAVSRHIARATYIAHVATRPEDMIGMVDAILLARDDAEAHYELAVPFLRAGLPIYIDKPISLSLAELERLYALQQYPGQIFTCSALRYAKEFHLDQSEREALGSLQFVEAIVPKDWDKYAIHAIEPLLTIIGARGEISRSQVWRVGGVTRLQVLWSDGMQAAISAVNAAAPIALRMVGERGWRNMVFVDTFHAFKAALTDFVGGVLQREVRSDPQFVRRTIELIELGRMA